MRRFLIALVLLLTVYFVFSRLTEVSEVWHTLGKGDWRWLALAALVQGAWLLNVAASLRAIYRLLGVHEDISHLIPVAAAANFVNVVAPSMGMGGMAIFVVDGQRRNLPSGRVTTGVALYVVYDYLGFLIVLALGLGILSQRHQLGTGDIVAATIFTSTAVILGALVYAGMRSAERLEHLLTALGHFVNRLLHPILRRDYLSMARAHRFAVEVSQGLHTARKSRGGLALPAALALSNKALMISILFLVFLAFGQPFSVGTLVAGFSIGYLFLIVSPTPSGIGFVEGAMTLVLNSLGVPLAAAAIVTLAYRGVTFWFPLLYGMVAFRLVGSSSASYTA
jgi:uncharacterized protein (TIRG00374 family)